MMRRRFQLIADNCTDILVRTRIDGTIAWASPALERETGLSPDTVVGFKVWALTAGGEEHIAMLQEDAVRLLDTGGGEILLRTSTGQSVWMSFHSGPFLEGHGAVSGRLLILRNVDAEVTSRRGLQASEDALRRVIHDAPIGMAIADPRGRLVSVNPALCRLLHRSPMELPLLRWDDILTPQDLAAVRSHVPYVASGSSPTVRLDVQCLRADGGRIQAELSISSLRGPDMKLQGFIAQVTDHTALHAALSLLSHQATHDTLTGLLNRAAAMELLQVLLADAQEPTEITLLFCDFDHFESINDVYGHAAGDRVLIEFARRLSESVGTRAHIARFGGDEFLVFLSGDAAHAEVAAIAADVVACTHKPIDIGDTLLQITVSVGMAVSPPGGDAEHLVRAADAAMYTAKARERGSLGASARALESAGGGPQGQLARQRGCSRTRLRPPPRQERVAVS